MRTKVLALLISLLPTCVWAETLLTVRITLSGYADNDPPGKGIAHPIIHRVAAVTGTYSNPITFAANPREFKPGTKIYFPDMQKYFIMEDDAKTAIANEGQGRPPLVVLWAGGTASSDVERLLATERFYTVGSVEIIIDPTPDHPVNAKPIFADQLTKRSADQNLKMRGSREENNQSPGGEPSIFDGLFGNPKSPQGPK
jgi:hypothetical protein